MTPIPHAALGVTGNENGRADGIRPYGLGVFRKGSWAGINSGLRFAWRVGGAVFNENARRIQAIRRFVPARTQPTEASSPRPLSFDLTTAGRTALIILLIAHLALTVAYSAAVPLGEAPDEADHWAYIVYLARERKMPESPAMTQAKHPPLYHATAALVASLAEPSADFLRANPDVRLNPADWDEAGSPNFFIHTALEDWPWRGGPLAFHLARLWSALLSTLTVAATFGLLRTALPSRPAVAWAGAGLLAFLPEFAFIGGSANNDNLAVLCGTLALWGGLAIFQANKSASTKRHEGSRRIFLGVPSCHFVESLAAGWWTPLALGFGLLAKVSTAALWPVVGAAIVAGVWPDKMKGAPAKLFGQGKRPADPEGGLRTASSPDVASKIRGAGSPIWQVLRHVLPKLLIVGLLVFLPALLIAAPWFWRNWTLYGDPLGMEFARQTVDVRTGPWTAADTVWLLRGWFISFWGKFGGAGHIPMAGWLYLLLAVLTGLSGLGLIRALIQWRNRDERLAVTLLALAAILTGLGIWRYSLVALGTDQGRLLYPAVGALVGLLAAGWLMWLPERWHLRAAVAITLLSLLLGLYGLLGVIRPAFAPPASATAQWTVQAPTSDRLAEPVTFGEITLVGVNLDGNPVLYWTAPHRPTQDWRVILRITAEDGTLIWEWKRSPGAGRFSTDRWPAGYVMRDVYRVVWPDWAGPGRYRVEVTAYPFDGEPVAPLFAVGWLVR